MRIEIKDSIVNHPIEGDIQKTIIIYYNDNDEEVTRENYTINHPLYGVDPNNLTRMDKFIISQIVSI